ncbi:diguanylate cyclase [Deinococcus oregonensis]|uniref:Diguanylate cyclase n=1 Tax=Deinococcus oregonensis TaxID=1805970 RepID=A0ABV6AWS7_9DEIO
MNDPQVTFLEDALERSSGPTRLAALNDLAHALAVVEAQRTLLLTDEASALVEACGDAAELLRATLSRGVALFTLGRLQEAEEALRRAAQWAGDQGQDASTARSLRYLGDTLMRMGQVDEAVGLLSQALALFSALQDPLGEADCFNALGALADMEGQYPEAAAYHRQALQRRRVAGRSDQVARSLGNLGHVWSAMGEPTRALQHHQQALSLFEGLDEPHNVARALINVALAYERLEQVGLALTLYEQAIPVLLEHGDEVNAALAQANLSALHVKMGQADLALPLAHTALEVFERQGVLPLTSVALLNVGTAQAALGDLGMARTVLQEALERSTLYQLPEVIIQAHEVLSGVLSDLGDPQGALEHLRHCLDLERSFTRQQAVQRTQAVLTELEAQTAWREAEVAQQRANELQRLNTVLEAAHEQQVELMARLDEQAHQDTLTGLYNRRYFDQQFPQALEQAQEQLKPLTVALLDIDHFKRINDTFSHLTGDLVLRRVASLLQEHCAPTDILTRYGGEEFVVLMPETDLETATRRCTALLQAVATHHWPELSPGERVTLSAGLADLGAVHLPGGLIGQADQQLYRAKQQGRNQVQP